MNSHSKVELRDDLLQGANEIAEFLGIIRRSVCRNIARGRLLGAFRMGGGVYARKSTLLENIEKLESQSAI